MSLHIEANDGQIVAALRCPLELIFSLLYGEGGPKPTLAVPSGEQQYKVQQTHSQLKAGILAVQAGSDFDNYIDRVRELTAKAEKYLEMTQWSDQGRCSQWGSGLWRRRVLLWKREDCH